ncbi:hypothetical protein OG497_37620 [Streptomyces sp. NBC_01242]|uniref:hypothetical protein n=1 Tax=Streptomyces sp. NBC_01242 TaxID=2903795 RepID=UPI00225430C8|nr:hypothetical protein [Streptomyces sp. NBC_01242]MCX4799577.1 hypothetical protein [Streptomyces sp. NBC_01242]
MSGNAQLAQTGIPTLVIGGVAYPLGGWMAVAAVAVLAGALLVLRFRFRPDLAVGEAADESGSSGASRRHRK